MRQEPLDGCPVLIVHLPEKRWSRRAMEAEPIGPASADAREEKRALP
jgi:hypothetical protein